MTLVLHFLVVASAGAICFVIANAIVILAIEALDRRSATGGRL